MVQIMLRERVVYRTRLHARRNDQIVDKALVENGSGKLMRWMAKKQLPRLERWKNK